MRFIKHLFLCGLADTLTTYATAAHNPRTVISLGGTANSQPNPIASTYPNNTTGTLNATIVVAPIAYTLARKLVPSQYNILPTYSAMLPSFPEGMYPLILQGRLDHDVQQDGIGIPDFVDFLIGFPFIDLLGDGYSTFTWTPSSFMAVDVVSIAGTELYGINVTTAIFDPPNDQYAFVPASENPTPGAIYFTATSLLGSTLVSAVYAPMASGGIGQYPLSFYQNVTNQPTFGNGIVCDNQIRFFNTPITQGDYLPIGIQGNITIVDPNMPQLSATYTNVFGVKLDTAFIENNLQNCTSLKGDTYQGE